MFRFYAILGVIEMELVCSDEKGAAGKGACMQMPVKVAQNASPADRLCPSCGREVFAKKALWHESALPPPLTCVSLDAGAELEAREGPRGR